MMRVALLIAAFALAACGADGPPERPGGAAPVQTTVSGRIEVGVTGG